ncbi:hypothetical protein [Kitasatospora sp. SUK 42]|uniref:hypothetical protein n=1 Tax=Kitasatospora sp. SUK 42 TaxID=1588882 RepID=UPI001C313278|nr:hypothetical protein [Kitasatospora sp. SUK 42]MBV2156547.1 hypothetical protein [Kitasatospora sp. SUK 42]
MVGVLTGMKLAVLRRSMSGPRAASLVLGAVTGTLAAVGTALLGLADFPTPGAGVGVVAAVLLLWTVGWALAPTVTGGDPTLRLDYLALVPQRPRTLALGLLGASFVGISPLVGLIAFTVLVVFGAGLGPLPALVAVPALLLQLLFVVVLSKLTLQSLGGAARSRLGWELSALLVGLVIGFLNTGWFAIGFFLRLLTGEWSAEAGTVVRVLPSGWSAVAVDAARRSDWALVAACLGGLLALSALLFAAWTALLARQLARGTAGGRPAAVGRAAPLWAALLRAVPDTPAGAVLGKELRLWVRDPRRARALRAALWTGVFTGLLPLLGGFDTLVPWTGVVAALFAGSLCANLYGLDAGALWLTLLVPGAERVDVRARQLAWLIVVAPAALLLTLAPAVAAPPGRVWPWLLAVLPAVLGAGAGLAPLMSLLGPAPSPDRPGGNPLDAFGDESADQGRMQGLAVLLLQLLAALPAAGVVLAGTLLHSAPLRWAGVAAGLGTGLLYAWWLGRAARRRLEADGPELLDVMRKGARRAPTGQAEQAEQDARDRLPRGRAAAVGLLITAGMLGVAPQGAVAMGMSFFAPTNRSWFAAMYLPPAWQAPAAGGFVLLGAGLLFAGHRLNRGQRAAAPSDPEPVPAAQAPSERATTR